MARRKNPGPNWPVVFLLMTTATAGALYLYAQERDPRRPFKRN